MHMLVPHFFWPTCSMCRSVSDCHLSQICVMCKCGRYIQLLGVRLCLYYSRLHTKFQPLKRHLHPFRAGLLRGTVGAGAYQPVFSTIKCSPFTLWIWEQLQLYLSRSPAEFQRLECPSHVATGQLLCRLTPVSADGSIKAGWSTPVC